MCRLTGRSIKFDQRLKTGVVETNQLLAAFGPEEDLIKILASSYQSGSRVFFAHASKQQTPEGVSKDLFSQIKQHFRTQFTSILPSVFDAIKSKIESATSEQLSEELFADINIEFNSAIPLGVFDEDENSISYSAITKTDSSIEIEKSKVTRSDLMVTSICMTHIHNRTIYLICGSEFRSKKDIDWVKSEVLKWRNVIYSANK
jgi:hypothetical protein